MRATADANLDELKKKARRRLVGAIVLALAAAVFVPMLLETDERPLGDDVSVRIPAIDQGKFVNRLNTPAGGKAATSPPPAAPAKPAATPKTSANGAASDPAPATPADKSAGSSVSGTPVTDAGKDAAPAASGSPVAASAVAAEAPAKSPVPPPADTVRTASAKPVADTATAHPPKAAASTTAKARGFDVQLAAFSDDKGANALVNRLKKSGYDAFTEPVSTPKGTLWRVRVGPFASRDDANATRDKLKREGQNGIVAARTT